MAFMTRIHLASVVAVLLALPGAASAQGPFPPAPEEYGPGMTVAGAGFAPRGERAQATRNAVDDARVRAESIAVAMSVTIGEVRAVEVQTPFEPRRACRPGDNPRRCAALEAVTTEVTFAIAGGPASDEGAREVSGTGTAIGAVAAGRKTNASVRRALREARRAATPDAANAARVNAEAAAAAAGVPLGPLFSVVEQTNAYGYDPVLGVYGPGQFCAKRRRVRVTRDPETGQRNVVRGRPVLRCYRPRRLPVSLEVTYLGA